LSAAARSCVVDLEHEGFSDRSLHRKRMAWPKPAHVHLACSRGPPPCI
jgi:hypothetical protein